MDRSSDLSDSVGEGPVSISGWIRVGGRSDDLLSGSSEAVGQVGTAILISWLCQMDPCKMAHLQA